MKILSTLIAASLSLAVSAQSPLVVQPAGTTYGWNVPPPDGQTFFNLTVNTTITLRAIETPTLSPVGAVGTLSVYLTNPGITTYVGNTANAANWFLAASGIIEGKGTVGALASLIDSSCQQTPSGGGLVLQPGSYGVALRYAGVAQALQAVTAATNISNTELTVSGGAIQYNGFVSGLSAPPGGFTGWSWWGNIVYALGSVPHACGSLQPYGAGCYPHYGSFYQEFTDTSTPSAAGAASAALSGRSLLLTFTGSSYVVVPGTSTYIAPTAAATALAASDDGEATVSLTNALIYPGGVATQLFVHSNGYVSVGSNNVLPGGPNFVPEIQPMLAAPETAWWSWHDYNPTEAGSGLIYFEEIGNLVLISWAGVESYPTTAANPSTFQFQFDTSNGNVEIVWQTIDATGGSGFLQGDDHLIGFSPGGASPDPGSINIGTLTGVTLEYPEVFPLTLTATGTPLVNNSVTFTTSNETTNPGIGLLFASAAQIAAPGFDLGIIGAGGCAALMDPAQGVGNLIGNGFGLNMAVTLPLPNNPSLAGARAYFQSVWLDPAANAGGLLTSNAVELAVGL